MSTLSEQTITFLSRQSGDYMSRDLIQLERMQQLQKAGRLQRILRFDVGSNTDGFSPLARDIFDSGYLTGMLETYLRDYPDNQYELLRRGLAQRFNLDPESFVLAAGLESMIDHICRAFLEPGTTALIPVPNFSIYEDYSARHGAALRLVPTACLGSWDESAVLRIERALIDDRPWLLWISNPVNPMGCLLPMKLLERLLSVTEDAGTIMIVDEAYGEYTDNDDFLVTAAGFVRDNPHVIVLRTFSKIYGLPNLRVGYMISMNEQYRRGVLAYRPTFPFSWLSLYTCQLALLDDDWLIEARSKVARRKPIVEDTLRTLGFEVIPSATNTIMFRHPETSGSSLQHDLANHGVLVANLEG